jgi:hypothetical protein
MSTEKTYTEELTGKEIAMLNNLPSHLGGIASRKALSIIGSQKVKITEMEGHSRSSDAGRDAAFDLIVESHNERDAAFQALELAKTEISELLASRHVLEVECNSLHDQVHCMKARIAATLREFDRLKSGEQVSGEFIKAMCDMGKHYLTNQ